MVDLVHWKGASGATYAFQLDPIGTAYHRRAGVYIFAKQVSAGQWSAGYVGMTHDFDERLNTRLQDHQAWPSIRGFGATHIGTLAVAGSEADRVRIETDLRHGLRCPCNLQ